MPRGVNHAEEFARVASKEYNVMKSTTGYGPQKLFADKGVSQSKGTSGINRSVKGKGASKKSY